MWELTSPQRLLKSLVSSIDNLYHLWQDITCLTQEEFMGKREEIRTRRKQAQRRNLLTWVLIIAGVAIVITGLVIYRTQASIAGITVPDFLDYSMADGSGLGDPNAPVLIEEFSDFQCPACTQFHDETLGQIIDTYVSTGQVYFVYRNFPILDRSGSTESHDAANAVYCAGDENRYYEFHDMLFANQIGEGAGSFTLPRLEAMGERLGLDPAFNDCVRDLEHAEEVLLDREAAFEAGFNSTPSFTINGQQLVGAQPFSVFVTAIETALAETEASSP
jgi:protein-disulfide isomerase